MQSRRATSPILAGFVIAAATLAGPASAQPCSPAEVAKLLAGDGNAGEVFGISVSVSGDVAVIGAAGDGDNGYQAGSAYVYRFNGTDWVEEAKLLASNGRPDRYFGFSVSVSGDVAVIGTFDDDFRPLSGSAYVYRFDGTNWVEEANLHLADGAAEFFGYSVSVSGDVAVIGTNYYNSDIDPGEAYIYRYDGENWALEAQLLPSDGAAGDEFGKSVSVSGDVAVIGAARKSDNGFESGSAYIYHFDGTNWAEQAKLLPTDGAAGDEFGRSVSASGDVAVVGSNGNMYVYRYDGTSWAQEAKLPPANRAGGNFGNSVSVSGDTAVVGAPSGDNDNRTNSGSAYVYRYDGANWAEQTKLLADDGAQGDEFGYSVSVSGDNAVIGAYQDEDNGDWSGSAYIFDLNCMTNCLADVNGDGVLTPADFDAWINAFNNNLPECDQNGDGSCTPTDFTAWIANFNAGC